MILDYIYKRVHSHNKNFLAVFCGETGSGKSLGALAMAEKLDPDFGEDNIVFSAKEFMEVLNSGKLKRGSVVLFDEAGVGLPSKEWYNTSNKMLNYVLQTFRHDNYIIFFTTPDLKFVDNSARKLFHCFFQTVMIRQSKQLCVMKPLFIENDPRSGKLYFKYKHFYDRLTKAFTKATRVEVPLPSKGMMMRYHQKKRNFTAWLNEGATLGIRSSEIVLTKELTDNQKTYLNLRESGLSNIEAANKMGCSENNCYRILAALKKKGYDFKKKGQGVPLLISPNQLSS